jgi:hypothetical protein
VPTDGPPPPYYGPPPSYPPNVSGPPPGTVRPYNYLPAPPPKSKRNLLFLIPVALCIILVAAVIGASNSSDSTYTSSTAAQNVTPYAPSTPDTSSCSYWTDQVRAINPAPADEWSTSELITSARIVVAHPSCFSSSLVASAQRLVNAADSTTY